ncbi:MAG TPA: hypothetical protein VI790_01605 [Candidatus Nanoarchaeia archaeon]|nr:hypothetical protein [Candidatus Nanoarchaeia archaeon]
MSDGVFDRISFPTEYHSEADLKSSLVLLFFTCLFFFVLSSCLIVANLFLFSKTLLLGTIAYELILFYLLDKYTENYIEKKIKGKAKKALALSAKLIFGVLLLTTFVALVFTMTTPNPATENKFVSLLISLLIIVAPTFFWHELIEWFKKKGYSKLKFLGLGIFFSLLVFNVSFAADNVTVANVTDTGIFGSLGTALSTFQKGVNFFTQVTGYIDNIKSVIQANLNLTEQQTQIVMLIAILVSAYFVLKFLSVIVKWVIVILIAWIVIQMFLL